MAPRKIFTIGHSTRSLGDFLALLRSQHISIVVDVRTIPRSRHNPQFNRETLPEALRGAGIKYLHVADLGGLRHAKKDSPNKGWRNVSFRGYADHSLTQEFERGLSRVIELARTERPVLMCAEAVPWRCHRSIIADALTVRGFEVVHIISGTRTQPHKLTPFGRVDGVRITYPEHAA